LAHSPFQPACTASSIEDVPSAIAEAGEQVLVLIGVRDGSDLVNDMCAAKASFPDAHVVILGDPGKRDLVMTALASGATSFVDENLATPTLIKELDLMTQGEPIISVSILKRLLGHSCTPPFETGMVALAVDHPELSETQGETDGRKAMAPAVDQPEPDETRRNAEHKSELSGREAAILNSLVDGASNKLIANQLKISEATVKVHVKAILRKIRVKNRTQAATWALRQPASAARLGNKNGGSLLSADVPSP
jgi:two-component system, NarL family, nitrate/nitrite response regulator NarL